MVTALRSTSGITTTNPTTGDVLKTFEALTETAIAQSITAAHTAFLKYRQTSFAERSHWLNALADRLVERKAELGKLITLEMGKPIAASIAEVEKSAWVCRYYAEEGERLLSGRTIETDATHSYVIYQPLGVILAVMPWNYPFWQVFRFAAPALMAGNVALLKHASNVPQCALAIAELFTSAGYPSDVFQSLLIRAGQVAQVIRDPRVTAATLTGSEAAGASLASLAGSELKKTLLELGGSDPFIVLESADLDVAVKTAVTARTLNNGQACIAAKRFILHEAIASEFTEKLVAQFKALRIGDPMQPETEIGPLATPQIVEEIEQQVNACLRHGATALVGGDRAALQASLDPSWRSGNFYPPTILTNFAPGSPAYQEEFFGPVALLFQVRDLAAAIALANGTTFGLGASVWTRSQVEMERCIAEIEAGSVFINGLVKSDPRLPFGGIKRSGYGRELGAEGIKEFVNLKTIWIKT
jgi:succinate-semialdehyde dehydrogenase / glutarate-semialdehyde dehydrogenase